MIDVSISDIRYQIIYDMHIHVMLIKSIVKETVGTWCLQRGPCSVNEVQKKLRKTTIILCQWKYKASSIPSWLATRCG